MGVVRSMTGYGRGEARKGGIGTVVEVRSVNHRFLDLVVKLPKELAAHEATVLRAEREAVGRGRVEVAVRRDVDGGATEVVADHELFGRVVSAVQALLGPDVVGGEALARTHALQQPGVLLVRAVEVDAADDEATLRVALASALAALTQMRETEGAVLLADLRSNIDGIGEHVGAIRTVVSDLRERAARRIQDRVMAMLGTAVDPVRVAQEAALLAEKADVAEELTRLDSHLGQLADLLAGGDAVGRKLEFLLQEMGREINTIGSKAVDVAVSRDVVEIKARLERLREQAANVE